jgi:hypothetical protein
MESDSKNSRQSNATVYAELKQKILSHNSLDLKRPCSYWVRNDELSLGKTLLGQSLQDLLRYNFDELKQLDGVGTKKVEKFVAVLRRLTQSSQNHKQNYQPKTKKAGEFLTAADISDYEWSLLCDTISSSRFANEPLGRLAPALKQIPTVLWEIPYKDYCKCSLSELRTRKAHGVKRIAAIVSAFRGLSLLIAEKSIRDRSAPSLPAFESIEHWVAHAPLSRRCDSRELEAFLANPLMQQMQADLPDLTLQILHERLGWKCRQKTVLELSKKHRLTRARVYQHLEIPTAVLALRWPAGKEVLRRVVNDLQKQYPAERDQPNIVKMINLITELLCP